DALGLRTPIDGAPRDRDRGLVDVGPEHLEPRGRKRAAQRLGELDRDRKRLLAGRAAGAPDPDVVAGPLARQNRGNDRLLELAPGLLVAEEAGDLDQHGRYERVELARLAIEQIQILLIALALAIRHAPLDAPAQGRPLVVAKIKAAGRANAF